VPAFPADDPARVQLELQAVPQGTAVSEIVRQLTSFLAAGHFRPGSRLPPERQLAESLGVGRSAVREALAALEILGIVAVRPGSGTYIRDSMSELLPTTLSWGLMLSASHTHQLSEVRSALEVQAAGLAATRIDEQSLAALRAHAETMRTHLEDLPRFIDADARFHVQIAASAGNEVLADLLQSIRSLLRLWTERGLRTREQADMACTEHLAILDAIAAQDPAAAQAAMHAHMRTAADRVDRAAPDAAPDQS
jgi:GntR family transcriptional regulator, transcriptional repressor for pyruvate dehydrogenase complex